jgi:hypothetical protein
MFTRSGVSIANMTNSTDAVQVTTKFTGAPLLRQMSPEAQASASGIFSLRSFGAVNTKAVNVVPGGSFPPSLMTGNFDTDSSTQTLGSGGVFAGSYTASSSNHAYKHGAPKAFAGPYNNGNRLWQVIGYPSGGGTVSTPTTAGYNGEWLQLQTPFPINLTGYSVGYGALTSLVLLASTDNSSWILVDSNSGMYPFGTITKTSLNFAGYSYFRFVVIRSSDIYPFLYDVKFNGTAPSLAQDFYADRLGNLLTTPVVGTDIMKWLGGATGYVAFWYDQSGAGNHMSCSSFGIQPKIDLVNNFIDLKPSAYFDVSAGTTGPVPFQSSKNYTVVFRHGQFIGAGLFATSQNAAGPYGNLVNNFKKGTGLTYTQYWYGNDVQNKGTLATGNRVSYKWDGTNRSLYVNGVLVDVSPSSGWAQTSSAIQMIGKTNLDGAMNGELYGAFMFTTALSDTDRTLLENFL